MIGAYLMGVPGAGKSTLLRHLLPVPLGMRRQPFPHLLYGTEEKIVGAQLGAYHPTFPGTDRLSMGIQGEAERFTREAPHPVLIGEGDRLTTEGYLRCLIDSTSETTIFWLDASAELAQARCKARGSNQNPKWILGRRTKVYRLAYVFEPHVVRLDASLPLDVLCETAFAASEAIRRLVPAGLPPITVGPLTGDGPR